MKFLFDMLPIIVFFIAYYQFDIYAATLGAILVSIAQVLWLFLRGKKPEIMHWVTLAMIVVLGGATLLLKNELFIKWKPTAVYWVLGLIFLGSQFIGQKSLVQRIMNNNIELPEKQWCHLNLSWAFFFFFMGGLNIWVVYNFSTDFWVNFKVFGTLGLTILFVLGQGIYLMRHIQEK